MSQIVSMQTKYQEQVQKELKEQFNLPNVMAVPRIEKIVINVGMGREALNNSTAISEMAEEIKVIAGQKPVVTKASKSVANFKLREGMDNGLKVTLRGKRMWDFYDKLVGVALPRVKDFRGVSRKAFDKRGNYALGIKEHTVFPEVDTERIVKIRPLQVIICTSAANDEQGFALLEKLGMPFKK